MNLPDGDDPGAMARSPEPAEARRAQLAALIPEAFNEGWLDVWGFWLARAVGSKTRPAI